MKILSAEQIHTVDQYTIRHEPIASIDLMERASGVFVQWFAFRFPAAADRPVMVFCGPGNNGGDGLAVARLLHERFYQVTVYRCAVSDSLSEDNRTNLERLQQKRVVRLRTLEEGEEMPALPPDAIVVDALFGSGLSRPVEGYWARLLQYLNEQPVTRVAIDIPSGLFADRHSAGTTFRAHHTLSFESPKLAFFMPENSPAVGNWEVRPIGLSARAVEEAESPFFFMNETMLRPLLIDRQPFDHKGTFGHAHIIAGSYGKMGAAILCSRATLRAGAGLVTVHVPKAGYEIMQISFPEAMVVIDDHKFLFSCPQEEVSQYDVIGIGPGLGTNEVTICAVETLLEERQKPMVLDADALNILAKKPELMERLPENSLLTPHPREFERLFGTSENDFARLEKQRAKARELGVYIVLKTGATAIACPDGKVFFNGTGNPGMGTAGTGDVLTGILSGLLAQGYSSENAARLGVYLHGLAGDLAAGQNGPESLIAEDVISHLGAAFQKLRRQS